MEPANHDLAANLLLNGSERDFLAALGACQSVHSVARSTGLSPRSVACAIRSMRIIFAANDGPVDDFLTLVENWDAEGIESFMLSETASPEAGLADAYVRSADGGDGGSGTRRHDDNVSQKMRNVIEAIERDWSAHDMRQLGASLFHLADALDQDWNPEAVQFSFHWPSAARQIERNAIELAKKATSIKRQLTMRKKYLPDAMLGEPTWNMLLELFCQFAGGASVSTKSLCIVAECPESTALRHIERLEEAGLIRRYRSRTDGRVTLCELTKRGVVGVGRVLERSPI